MTQLLTDLSAARYLATLLQVLNTSIVKTLQYAYDDDEVRPVVAGGKALNEMQKPAYNLPSIDWELNVWNPSGGGAEAHTVARDGLGEQLAQGLNGFAVAREALLQPINKYFDTDIHGFRYIVDPRVLHALNGESFTVGHVDVQTSRYGSLTLATLLALPHRDDRTFVEFNAVRFLAPQALVNHLLLTLTINEHPKKAQNIRRMNHLVDAMLHDGLSCNFYRYELVQLGEDRTRELQQCADNTAMGVFDPLAGSRKIPRFHIAEADIAAHAAYIASLSEEEQAVLYLYTTGESAVWNLQLIQRFAGQAVDTDPQIDQLQRIILAAPPLQEDAIVYKMARYLFVDGASNADYRVQTTHPQHVFGSTTYDNQLNFSPFLSPFSDCCCYTIRIPAQSRVLIVDQFSAFPQEHEVLLPIGCQLFIEQAILQNVTYTGQYLDEVWYDERHSYHCRYLPVIDELPPVRHLDFSAVRNAAQLDNLLTNSAATMGNWLVNSIKK